MIQIWLWLFSGFDSLWNWGSLCLAFTLIAVVMFFWRPSSLGSRKTSPSISKIEEEHKDKNEDSDDLQRGQVVYQIRKIEHICERIEEKYSAFFLPILSKETLSDLEQDEEFVGVVDTLKKHQKVLICGQSESRKSYLLSAAAIKYARNSTAKVLSFVFSEYMNDLRDAISCILRLQLKVPEENLLDRDPLEIFEESIKQGSYLIILDNFDLLEKEEQNRLLAIVSCPILLSSSSNILLHRSVEIISILSTEEPADPALEDLSRSEREVLALYLELPFTYLSQNMIALAFKERSSDEIRESMRSLINQNIIEQIHTANTNNICAKITRSLKNTLCHKVRFRGGHKIRSLLPNLLREFIEHEDLLGETPLAMIPALFAHGIRNELSIQYLLNHGLTACARSLLSTSYLAELSGELAPSADFSTSLIEVTTAESWQPLSQRITEIERNIHLQLHCQRSDPSFDKCLNISRAYLTLCRLTQNFQHLREAFKFSLLGLRLSRAREKLLQGKFHLLKLYRAKYDLSPQEYTLSESLSLSSRILHFFSLELTGEQRSSVHEHMAETHLKLGKHRDEEKNIRQAIDNYQAALLNVHNYREALLWNSLGHCHWSLAEINSSALDLEASSQAYCRSLKCLNESNQFVNELERIACLNNLAVCYKRLALQLQQPTYADLAQTIFADISNSLREHNIAHNQIERNIKTHIAQLQDFYSAELRNVAAT